MDVWAILREIGKFVWWGAEKVWSTIVWGHAFFIPLFGEAGALIFMFVLLFVPSTLIFFYLVATTQAQIENTARGIFGVLMKVFAVFVCTVLILFVLSVA